MKLLVTADLHYNIARSRGPTEALARQICSHPHGRDDALVLVGDTAGADLHPLHDCLRLFDGFAGHKLLVPGNHCLWCRHGDDSIDRYERLIPELAAQCGFTVLDHNPQRLGQIGLVGSIGWYDYSLRDRRLGVPLAFYRRKVSPGAAIALGGYDELLAKYRLSGRARDLTVRWMDGWHVKLPVSDAQFTERLAKRLSEQIDELSKHCRTIVAMLHHLPFAQLVPPNRPDRFAFAAAYLGSIKLGDVLLERPKVKYLFCGHSHWPMRLRVGHIEAVNVGSTYTQKRMEILDLGEHA